MRVVSKKPMSSVARAMPRAVPWPVVNAFYTPDPVAAPRLTPKNNQVDMSRVSEAHWSNEPWSTSDIRDAQHSHAVASWGATSAIANVPILTHGKGVYLYDREGNNYIDWTSQAVCANLGHDPPKAVIEAVTKQLTTLPMVYGGTGMSEIRARFCQLMSEIMPGDINGFLFPSGGGEANDAAVRIARRFTGRQKVLSMYRSYHGSSSTTLAATGDFRRNFGVDAQASGFIKMLNPTPRRFAWGHDAVEAGECALAAVEEQILAEGPETIAAMIIEPIVGAGGVLMHPEGYVQGLRALCDKYGMLLIADEVMVGFGRTGKMWGFQHYEGVLPDIVTSAKGLTSSYLPLSVIGMRQHIKEHFEDKALGWGATYHAHPVSMACGYEVVKHLLAHDLVGRAKEMEEHMLAGVQNLVDRHACVGKGRVVGMIGCVDLVDGNNSPIQPLPGPSPPSVINFRAALRANGVYGLVRPPYLHCAPPLIITPEELDDGFDRVSRSLDTLDSYL